MRRQTVNFSAIRTRVEGNNGGLICNWPDLPGPGAAPPAAVRADLWNDSSTALPPCQKLVSCFLHVSSISLLKLNVFLN